MSKDADGTRRGPIRLSNEQRAKYDRDGFLVLRDYLDSADLAPLDRGVERHVPRHAYAPRKIYPEPAKYTLSGQIAADPDFASIAEHPKVVGVVEEIFGRPAHLTAYVVYVRTPWDKGSAPHNDYKRWRPVGSSVDWLFTIIPLTDFDLEHGPLLVAPGSHELAKVSHEPDGMWQRARPRVPKESEFVNPGLARGDLLLMNMYTWHWAPKNDLRRIGIFNKYAAADAPAATGPYVLNRAVYDAFSDAGKRLLPVCSDLDLDITRLVLSRGEEVLLVGDGEDGPWSLPGGAGFEEDAIPGWDVGNRIGALDAVLRSTFELSLPWMSWIGDFDESTAAGPGRCRVYGYRGEVVPTARNGQVLRWFSREALERLDASAMRQDYLQRAVTDWFDAPVRRGKGLTQAQSRIDQYVV